MDTPVERERPIVTITIGVYIGQKQALSATANLGVHALRKTWMAYARTYRRGRRWTITAPETQRPYIRGRTLVLADIGIVLLSSVVYSIVMVVVTGPGALLERVPAFLMVMLVAWALYAGYAPIRWVWVVTNLGLAAAWGVSPVTSGEQSVWLAGPMAVGHGFVGLTLALSSSVRRFLADRRTSHVADGPFDPAYTATLAFLGCFYLWGLGGVLDRLGWGPDEFFLTIFAVPTLGGLGILYLAVAAMRFVGIPLARPVTSVVSFLLAVQFPFGTAVILYWLLKVREHERTAAVDHPPVHGEVAQSTESTSDSPSEPEGR